MQAQTTDVLNIK